MNTLNDVTIDSSKLLKKGYNAKDLEGKYITVSSVSIKSGDDGDYISCEISGDGIEVDKPLNTGSQNVKVKLLAAAEQGKLPITVKIVKLGGNAFDIE